MKFRLLLALVLGALLAPAASAKPARELTATGIPGAVVADGRSVSAAGNCGGAFHSSRGGFAPRRKFSSSQNRWSTQSLGW